jgi:hypothetical protein
MKIEIAILIVAAVACAGEGSQPSLYDQETQLFESMVHPVDDVEENKEDETELVQVPFYRTLFRGVRQHLSNYDHHPIKKKAVRIVHDFVSSASRLSSAASLASYENIKRLDEGKKQTRRLNGGYGRKSHYAADYSASNDHPNGVLNPGFRHGPRNNEMDREVKKIQSRDAERELKTRTSKLFDEYKKDVGQDGWGH